MLTGSSQTAMQSVVPSGRMEHTDTKTAGVKAGTKSFVSLQTNIVNPTPRPSFGASAPARDIVGVAGRGNWKKQRPLCNGADKGCNVALPCKRADFQSVVHDERTHRTFTGGNGK
jgi:hypothetical protein